MTSLSSTTHSSRELSYNGTNTLTMAGFDLAALADEHGTPLFVASKERLVENTRAFLEAFSTYPEGTLLSYSCKTNGNLAVLGVLRQQGVMAGVCSGLDYYAARKAGFAPDEIIFDGLVKTDADLDIAVRDGVCMINVESLEEIRLIDALARRYDRRVRVGIRVRLPERWGSNLTVKAALGFGYDRFGFDLDSGLAFEACREVSRLPHLELCGLHTHSGSHYRSATPYLRAARKLLPLVRRVRDTLGIQIRYLNLGGGFGVNGVWSYRVTDLLMRVLRKGMRLGTDCAAARGFYDIQQVGRQISRALTTMFEQTGLEPCRLVFEPGRFIVGDAFVLLTKVLVKKKVPRSGTWIVLDAGTNLISNLLLLSEFHRVLPVRRRTGAVQETVHMAGPLLYSSDVIHTSTRLPSVEIGDYVAVLDAGAYTLAYSNQFLWPRPRVILLAEDGVRVIREKETFDDVVRKDCL